MVDKTYAYSNQKTLNQLVMLIPEYNCEFYATLMPDIPEFIEEASKARSYHLNSSDFPEIDKRLKKEQLTHVQIHAFIMLELCEKYNILPFWVLKFSYDVKIDQISYNLGYSVCEELYKNCKHPVNFTKGSKWYSIEFEEVSGEEDMGKAKLAIAKFTEQDYTVTSLSARFKPYTRRGDHLHYNGCKGSLYASKGKVDICGEVPDDFKDLDIENLPEPTKQLPEPPKLLENLVVSLIKSK